MSKTVTIVCCQPYDQLVSQMVLQYVKELSLKQEGLKIFSEWYIKDNNGDYLIEENGGSIKSEIYSIACSSLIEKELSNVDIQSISLLLPGLTDNDLFSRVLSSNEDCVVILNSKRIQQWAKQFKSFNNIDVEIIAPIYEGLDDNLAEYCLKLMQIENDVMGLEALIRKEFEEYTNWLSLEKNVSILRDIDFAINFQGNNKILDEIELIQNYIDCAPCDPEDDLPRNTAGDEGVFFDI